MDSQHRHELEQNDLANWVGDLKDKVAPYTMPIVASAIVVVVLLTGWSLSSASSAQQEDAAWRSYSQAFVAGRPNLNALEDTSEEFAGKAVSEWADITWADGQLWTASNLYLTNRSTADEALAKAKEKYEALIKSASAKKVKDRAKFGLARAYELEGDIEQAIEKYGQVAGAFQELAEDRAEKLAEPSLKADYTWLTSAVASKGRRGAMPSGQQLDMTPDDVALPEASAEQAPVNTEETLGDILKSYGETDEVATEKETEEETEKETEEAAEGTAPEEADTEEAASEDSADATEADVDTSSETNEAKSEE